MAQSLFALFALPWIPVTLSVKPRQIPRPPISTFFNRYHKVLPSLASQKIAMYGNPKYFAVIKLSHSVLQSDVLLVSRLPITSEGSILSRTPSAQPENHYAGEYENAVHQRQR